MLRILIVEDEPLFAQTLRHLVELNPLYQVTAVAEDSATMSIRSAPNALRTSSRSAAATSVP